jgi:DNA replication protein DnaC
MPASWASIAPSSIRTHTPPQPGSSTSFDFTATPSLRKAHLAALAAGDAWIEQGANVLIFGPSGTGKTHAAAAIGAGLIDHGYRVLFTRTADLVQKLQAARRDLALPAALAKLDKFVLAKTRPDGRLVVGT